MKTINKKESTPQPNTKIEWRDLDSSSKSFWNSGGRGGELGYNLYENNKKF
jgi:hypothetical protein